MFMTPEKFDILKENIISQLRVNLLPGLFSCSICIAIMGRMHQSIYLLRQITHHRKHPLT